ncbi:heterokaryon incompatibility protein-domain-containing protein [Podospora didyma]|uniref:Heterokaryon incompatibility protein-domain-containing protein n=1 Tax=Podospora didyma TaxID=330526 RepID=A0AAE0K1L7_9PEZI|nr:heterokaryon incompatibility protein-domain-containing protein [Podospora didyma]
MTTSLYPYQPLNLPDETRILTVLPGSFEDELVCSLSYMLYESPDEPYEALSYCWSRSVAAKEKLADTAVLNVAAYGYEPDGTLVDMGESLMFRDLLDHTYHARSYIRLGGALPDGEIICDGVPMTVGGELHRALRRLRSEDKTLRIWVDALCINQQDVDERNEHVKTMGAIYAGADRVRVWLGEEIGIETEAVRTMHNIDEVMNDLLLTRGLLEKGASLSEIQWQFVNTCNTEAIEWAALAELLERAWFHRTWVIQEIASARDVSVQIGQFELSWARLAGLICGLRQFKLDAPLAPFRGPKAIYMMDMLRRERVEEGLPRATMPLLTMLEELREFESTIASDKIYGILGLTDSKNVIEVDYSKTPEEIFTILAVDNLRSGSLDILSHCLTDIPDKPAPILNLPSWVPDWTRPGWVEPFRVRDLRANACGSRQTPDFTIDLDAKPGVLHIKGLLLDRIAVVETKKPIPMPSLKFGVEIGGPGGLQEDPAVAVRTDVRNNRLHEKLAAIRRDWYLNVLAIVYPDRGQESDLREAPILCHPRFDSTQEALWRTFMCNRTRDNETLPPLTVPDGSSNTDSTPAALDWDGDLGWGIFMENQLNLDAGPREIMDSRVRHEMECHGLAEADAEAFFIRAKKSFEVLSGANARWCYNRRFFKTEAGRFGWGVNGVRAGDVVGVFYGGQYPFVLREVEETEGGNGVDGTSYRIVGDCYLNGTMDGEAPEEVFGATETEFRIV